MRSKIRHQAMNSIHDLIGDLHNFFDVHGYTDLAIPKFGKKLIKA